MANPISTDGNPEISKSIKRVIFICTGNSCRSQMAEAIINHKQSDKWKAYSAGTQPTGRVHPLVNTVLKEIGISHEGRSKTIDEFYNVGFDLVITVCDAAAEKCPIWLGKGIRAHAGFPDPAKEVGTSQEILEAFRQVRDDIMKKIPALLDFYY